MNNSEYYLDYMADSKFEPKVIDTSRVKLSRDLTPLVEMLSENTHNVWAAKRLREGWSPGERNDERRTNPCLVEYSDLPEGEKDYDRNVSVEVLKVINVCGFRITKRGTGCIMVVGEYSGVQRDSIRTAAGQRNLQVRFFSNWEDARDELIEDMEKWLVILFDGNARLERGAEPSRLFLRDSIDELNAVFNRKCNEIPWFVVPSSDFDNVKMVASYSIGRDRERKDWGAYLRRIEDIDGLMQDIAALLPKIPNYRLRCVYDNVFGALEEFFPPKTKDLLFDVLMPIHSPERFYSFEPSESYDNIRMVIEAFFSTCGEYELIPGNICFDHNNGAVNLAESCNYINGAGRSVFPKSIGCLVEYILNKTNPGCHFSSDDDLYGYYYSVLGLSLMLCDVIVWLGTYIRTNRCVSIKAIAREYVGKVVKVKRDDYGYFYYGKCQISTRGKSWFVADGATVRIRRVDVNRSESRKRYSLIAEVEKAK